MAIDRQHNCIVFECDSCDATFAAPVGADFAHAWGDAKREGWRARKVGRDWVHGCPDCGVD